MDLKFDALNFEVFACLRPFSQQFNPIWSFESLFAFLSLNIQNEWDYM